jgi:hypothetical protein
MKDDFLTSILGVCEKTHDIQDLEQVFTGGSNVLRALMLLNSEIFPVIVQSDIHEPFRFEDLGGS